MSQPRVVIVANPISGRGRARRAAAALERALGAIRQPTELRFTECAGDGARIAGEVSALPRAEVDLIVSVGGDGTMREVVSGVRDPELIVGMLPTGTANILARELRLPHDADGCARVVADRRSVPFDLAEANGKRFLMVAGVGFDAAVTRAVNEGRTSSIRMSSYVLPVLRSLWGFQHPQLRVTVLDDNGGELAVHEGVLSLVLGNIRAYGGPFEIASYAFHASGDLELVLMRGRRVLPRITLIMAGALARVAPLLPGVSCQQVHSIRVEAEHPVPYQIDGDFAGETPVTFRLLPHRARILAPLGTP